LRVTGGAIAASGDVNLTGGNSAIAFAGAAAATGHVDVQGAFVNHPLSGDVPAGYSLSVQQATLQASASWTNAGTISLVGGNPGTATLETVDNNSGPTEVLTNTGTINSSGTDSQDIYGDVSNQGTLSINTAGFRFRRGGVASTRDPKLTNSGTLTVLSGDLLTVQDGGTLEQAAGGTINGPGAVDIDQNATLRVTGGAIAASGDVNLTGGNSAIAFVGAAAATGHVDVQGAFVNHPLSGDVPAGYSLSVQQATLQASASWTNAGTISLVGGNSGTATLATQDGNAATTETLTNTGTIATSGTNSQDIFGDVSNQGTLSINTAGFRFRNAGSENRLPKLTNVAPGAINLASGAQLDATSALKVELQGGTLTTAGNATVGGLLENPGGDVRPGGSGIATLSVDSYKQPGGTLTVDVATSGGSSTNDRLAVGADATLGGRLQVRTQGGGPAVGSRFSVVTTAANQRFGTFADVRGLTSGPFKVEYSNNKAELVTVLASDVPALSVGDASVTEGNAGTADLAFPVTISPAPAPGVTVQVHYATSDGTASAGSDYTATSGTLTFAPGETQKLIHVLVTGDTAAEPDETLLVSLDSPAGAPIRQGRATGTIRGDDIAINSLTPDRGGEPGSATITVAGAGFDSSSTLTLTHGGTTINGANPTVNADGTSLSATFDLTGAAHAAWDVNATGRGGTSASRAGGFTVEAAREGGARIPVTGTAPGALRSGFLGTYKLTMFNTGNVDENICLIRITGTNVEFRRLGADAFVSPTLEIDGNEPSDTPGQPKIGVLPANSYRTLTVEFKSTTQVAHAPLGILAEVFTCKVLPRGTPPPPPPPPPPGHVLPPPDPEIKGPFSSGSTDSTVDNRVSNDPNSLDGPVGVDNPAGGTNEHWIRPDGALGYSVHFENTPTASAPAALVTVTETLDSAIDLNSFELGSLGWGGTEVHVPGGLQSYHGQVTLPDGDLVYVDASLNRSNRTVTWNLQTINPDTGQPETDPDRGFLPPESGNGNGNGHVEYSARLLDSVPDGATVGAQAQVVFDVNAPINTPTWTNTVDRQAPQAAVTSASQPGDAKGAGCKQQLDVGWSGSDPSAGSGLASYAILVSKDGGPYQLWSTATTATAASLTTVAGASYSFISVARDQVGNEPAVPTAADKTVTTHACPSGGVDFGAKLKITVSLSMMKSPKTALLKVKNGYAFPVTGRLRLLGPKVKGKRRPITGFKSLAVGARKTKPIALKITGATKRALSAGKKVKVTVSVEVKNSAGQKRTLTRNLTLKVKKKGKKK
jgi:hypothetical protein